MTGIPTSYSFKVTEEDKDLFDALNPIPRGQRSERIKVLVRLGLAVEAINILQALIDKGIVHPLEVAAAGESQLPEKSLDEQRAAEFMKNMMESFHRE